MQVEKRSSEETPNSQTQTEDSSLDGKNLLESIFFTFVDYIRKKLEIEIDRNGVRYFDKFIVDVLILFSLLFIIAFFFQFLPLTFSDFAPLNSSNYPIEIIIFLLLCSVLWVGYVYINFEFRSLIIDKILPVQNKGSRKNQGLYNILPNIFCGICWKSKSGHCFQVYIRTILSLALIIPPLMVTFIGKFASVFTFCMQDLQLQTCMNLIFLCFYLITIGFILFMIMYTFFTVMGIFVYLFLAVRLLPLEINPLIFMGGTEKFGKIILNCIYLISVTIGVILLLFILSQFDMNQIFMAHDSFQTIGNSITTFKGILYSSIENMPYSRLSDILNGLFIYFLFVLFAMSIIISLHFRIRERKKEELDDIEKKIIQIQNTDFSNITEKNIYLLNMYDRIQNLHEWPIKKFFFVELIISTIPILISYFLL